MKKLDIMRDRDGNEAWDIVKGKVTKIETEKEIRLKGPIVEEGIKEIEVVEKSKKQLRITSALEIADQIGFVPWVEVDVSGVKGGYKHLPERSDLPPDINEALVVALYSK